MPLRQKIYLVTVGWALAWAIVFALLGQLGFSLGFVGLACFQWYATLYLEAQTKETK